MCFETHLLHEQYDDCWGTTFLRWYFQICGTWKIKKLSMNFPRGEFQSWAQLKKNTVQTVIGSKSKTSWKWLTCLIQSIWIRMQFKLKVPVICYACMWGFFSVWGSEVVVDRCGVCSGRCGYLEGRGADGWYIMLISKHVITDETHCSMNFYVTLMLLTAFSLFAYMHQVPKN